MSALHIVKPEECECCLVTRLASLPRPHPFAVNVETRHLREAVAVLERYRSTIAFLQDQLAAQCQPSQTPATSSDEKPGSTTADETLSESSPTPNEPPPTDRAECPITASPSEASPAERSP